MLYTPNSWLVYEWTMQIHRNGSNTVFGLDIFLIQRYFWNVICANECRRFGRTFGQLLYARIKRRLLLVSALSLPKPSASTLAYVCNNHVSESQHTLGSLEIRCTFLKPTTLQISKYCLQRNAPPVSLTNNINLLIDFVCRRYTEAFLRSFPSQTMSARSRAYLLRPSWPLSALTSKRHCYIQAYNIQLNFSICRRFCPKLDCTFAETSISKLSVNLLTQPFDSATSISYILIWYGYFGDQ